MSNFTSKINDFYKKIQNSNRNEIFKKINDFVLHYWFILLLLLVLFVIIQIKMKFNSSFHTNKITKFIPDSTYAGNGVVLNKVNFLTTYDVVHNVCKPKNRNQDTVLFAIAGDGKYYGVRVVRQSKELNLAVLEITDSYKDSTSIRNYAVFPKQYNSLLEKNVYVSKTKNTNKSYFYKNSKIKGISSSGYFIKRNNFRTNRGESVLNENLEFVGIAEGNSVENVLKFPFNEVNIVGQNKIENFLIANRIVYRRNFKDINLFEINNYLKEINVKIVCYLKENRMPIIIRTNQLL